MRLPVVQWQAKVQVDSDFQILANFLPLEFDGSENPLTVHNQGWECLNLPPLLYDLISAILLLPDLSRENAIKGSHPDLFDRCQNILFDLDRIFHTRFEIKQWCDQGFGQKYSPMIQYRL